MIDPIYSLTRRADEDDEDEDEDQKKERREASPGIGEKLFKARTILLFGGINDKLAREITAQVLAMASESDDPIKLVINSPGGHVESGDTVHDLLRFVRPKVQVIGTGWVASAAAHIFLGAPREDRYCLPNTRFLLHQPMGGVRGPATDIDIEAAEIIKMRERINRTISEETGQAYEKVARDTDRNFWMSADEARDYGIVTHIVRSIDEVQ